MRWSPKFGQVVKSGFCVSNQQNGTHFKPYTFVKSGGIYKLLETLVIVSATINRLYLHLLPALQYLFSPAI